MKNYVTTVHVLFIISLAIMFTSPTLYACTGLFSKAEDGSVVYARTMEFGLDLNSKVLAVAKGHKYIGSTPTGKDGAEWESKYNILGMNFFNSDFVADGINEEGLQAGGFYFAGQCKYQDFSKDCKGRAIAPEEFMTWALSNFKSVKEVEAHYKDIVLVNTVNKNINTVFPIHYLFVDKSGDSLVIEFLESGIAVQKNPVGVFTNNPEFSWHLTNLRTYVGLSPENVKSKNINGYDVVPFGQGTGMKGLPGDITSPSRFIRGVYKLASVTPFKDAEDGLNKVIRAIKYFYISKGNVVEAEKGNRILEYTQYELYKNLNDFVMYVDFYDNVNIKKVDGNKIDFSKAEVQFINFDEGQLFEDITDKMVVK